jgi:nitroreductase/NAD-dependent dihydropyrimidine dehydrogenase PreA subunit
MLEISINEDVCKKDGFCARACVSGIFQQEKMGTIPKIEHTERCILCGHCVAICPHGAISHSHFPEGSVSPLRADLVPTYDQVLELIRSRRSKRLFKAKTVERDVIEKVLEAARFAPSGHNDQSTEFIVIQDKKKIHEIAALTAGYLGKLAKQFQNPIGKTIMSLILGRRAVDYVAEFAPEVEGLVSMFHDGIDWILRKPPVLLLFCADSIGGTMTSINANIALQNATLAAEALGLGCFYTGFVIIACDRDDSIAKLLSLPKTHKIYGGLAIGYPQLSYTKWPERNPAKVTWMGFD